MADSAQMLSACHDPMREISRQIEEMGVQKFQVQLVKINGQMAFTIAAFAAFFMQVPLVPWAEFLKVVEIPLLAAITAIIQIVAYKMVVHSSFLSFQMTGKGSNMLGTMCKILEKLSYMELRLMEIVGLAQDAERVAMQTVRDHIDEGKSWPVLRQALEDMKIQQLDSGASKKNKKQILESFHKQIKFAVAHVSGYLGKWKLQLEEMPSNQQEKISSRKIKVEAGLLIMSEMATYVAQLDDEIKST